MSEKSNQTTVNGVRAIELYYRAIREIEHGNTAFYQSQTRLNTPGLGTLMPENFRDVSEVTNQCVSLFDLEFLQALETCNKFKDREIRFDWLSVYVSAKYLIDQKAERNILTYCQQMEVPTNKICFALSEKILEETDGAAARTIRHLRNRGFHFMVTDFGNDACPIMRLSSFECDYVMFSPEVTGFLGKDDRSDSAVRSLIDFVTDLGAEPIADGVFSSMQAEKLFSFECRYCAGSIAGKYSAERYIRQRGDNA
ncbi:MAG: EAL domain-containing protein [Ruminococcus sp.]|nr:EAL domain-containing protein [Ruminococcus sp.]